jgi:hypothetical protein
MVGTISPRQLGCYTCASSLPNVTNTSKTLLKKGNKFEKYETLLNTSMEECMESVSHMKVTHTTTWFSWTTYHDLGFLEQKTKSFLQVFN